jgi:hypothetical protein
MIDDSRDQRRIDQDRAVRYAIKQFPHCDARVLHAPGECQFCDKHPDWQALRILWNIAFTGHDPYSAEEECPAEQARPRDTINRWGGNIPRE